MDIDYKKVKNVINYIFSTAVKGNPESVLKAFEDYFYEHEPIMIVGDKKGTILKQNIEQRKPKVLVELGGYIGYSSIYMGNLIKNDPSAHFYSVEYDSILVSVMERVIKFAGLENKITVLNGDLATVLPKLQKDHNITTIDLFFIDHIKSAYVSDFNLADNSKLFANNSVIIADNVIYPGAPEYIKHVNNHPKFDSEIHEFLMEGHGLSIKDGIMVSTIKSSY
ncbi:catechol O-methyltransferase [Neoconidiobolus thromboides FSU 785]|nr:catechol O-methyltransferase [Neoconidiobolus thromboides FSU 785]